MDVLEFRRRVVAALQTAGVQVGTHYIPRDGTEPLATPAVSVDEPPAGTTASGLEVLIYGTPRPQIVSTFGGNINLPQWQLRLIKHDESADLDGAMDAIFEAFPTVPTPQLIPEAGDIAEQVLFTIPDDPQ